MPAPISYEEIAKSNINTQSAPNGLFAGQKLWFSVTVPQRAWLAQNAQNNGAVIVRLEQQADVRLFDHARKNAAPGTYSYKYVEQSIRNGQLEPLDEHLIASASRVERPVGSIKTASKGGRNPFTEQEDQLLWNWVKPYMDLGGQWKGNEIYKQLERINPRHTFQSWRDRFIKHTQFHNRQITEQVGPAYEGEVDEIQATAPSPKRRRVARKHQQEEQSDQLEQDLPDLQVTSKPNSHREIASLDMGQPQSTIAAGQYAQDAGETHSTENEKYLLPPGFTKEDVKMLYTATVHILNTNPDQIDKAWNHMAAEYRSEAAHANHDANSWRSFFHNSVVPEYRRRNNLKTEEQLEAHLRKQIQKEQEEKEEEKRAELRELAQRAMSMERNLVQVDDGATKSCANCFTIVTHRWRNDKEGRRICDACGRFLKVNGFMRPSSTWTEPPVENEKEDGTESAGISRSKSVELNGDEAQGDGEREESPLFEPESPRIALMYKHRRTERAISPLDPILREDDNTEDSNPAAEIVTLLNSIDSRQHHHDEISLASGLSDKMRPPEANEARKRSQARSTQSSSDSQPQSQSISISVSQDRVPDQPSEQRSPDADMVTVSRVVQTSTLTPTASVQISELRVRAPSESIIRARNKKRKLGMIVLEPSEREVSPELQDEEEGNFVTQVSRLEDSSSGQTALSNGVPISAQQSQDVLASRSQENVPQDIETDRTPQPFDQPVSLQILSSPTNVRLVNDDGAEQIEPSSPAPSEAASETQFETQLELSQAWETAPDGDLLDNDDDEDDHDNDDKNGTNGSESVDSELSASQQETEFETAPQGQQLESREGSSSSPSPRPSEASSDGEVEITPKPLYTRTASDKPHLAPPQLRSRIETQALFEQTPIAELPLALPEIPSDFLSDGSQDEIDIAEPEMLKGGLTQDDINVSAVEAGTDTTPNKRIETQALYDQTYNLDLLYGGIPEPNGGWQDEDDPDLQMIETPVLKIKLTESSSTTPADAQDKGTRQELPGASQQEDDDDLDTWLESTRQKYIVTTSSSFNPTIIDSILFRALECSSMHLLTATQVTTTIFRTLTTDSTLFNKIELLSMSLTFKKTSVRNKKKIKAEIDKIIDSDLIPGDMQGCWTRADDKMLLSTDAREIEAVGRKHGNAGVRVRFEYLEMVDS